MIWSPYAITRAVYGYNKYQNRTFRDRMVCALNEAARVHGLKGVDDALINELLKKINDYENEIQSLNKEIIFLKENLSAREKDAINKRSQAERKSSILMKKFSELKTLCNSGMITTYETKREHALNSIWRIVDIDIKRILESTNVEGDSKNDMRNGD